jgi:predicted transcriptional regulator
MRKPNGEQIWLLIAERDKPMSTLEIAKELGIGEQIVQDILKQEQFRFQPTSDGKWELTVWHIDPARPFVTKAELIFWFARCPIPTKLLLQLLRKVHNQLQEEGMLRVLKSRADKFICENDHWRLVYPDTKTRIERYVQELIKSKQTEIYKLFVTTKEPVSLCNIKAYIELERQLESFASAWRLNETERAFMEQLANSHLLHTINDIDGIICLPNDRWIVLSQNHLWVIIEYLRNNEISLTAREILKSVLGIICEETDEAIILSELEHLLSDCEQLEYIDDKWLCKKPFASRFIFYDPETFVVVVEKDERIDVGSEKERWLKEKGFYITARFGR